MPDPGNRTCDSAIGNVLNRRLYLLSEPGGHKIKKILENPPLLHQACVFSPSDACANASSDNSLLQRKGRISLSSCCVFNFRARKLAHFSTLALSSLAELARLLTFVTFAFWAPTDVNFLPLISLSFLLSLSLSRAVFVVWKRDTVFSSTLRESEATREEQ